MAIMTSYFRIRDDVIKIFINFTRFWPIVYSYQVSPSSDLNQKKNTCFFDHVFSQAIPPLIGYQGNNKWPIPKFLMVKDDQNNCLKSQKVWWRRVKPFLRYLAKPLGGHFGPPVQIGLTLLFLGGGVESTSSRGFSNITQKRDQIFFSNLVTFLIDKWVTICTIKIEDRPFQVAMAIAQIKGPKMTIFLNSAFRNGISNY